MQTVVVICFGDMAKDSRVLRQIHWLKDRFRIITVGGGGTGD